jgi:hypothetical protein
MEKTVSRIQGLDEILEEGISTGTTTCLCGQAGTGKRVSVLQYICLGAGSVRMFIDDLKGHLEALGKEEIQYIRCFADTLPESLL